MKNPKGRLQLEKDEQLRNSVLLLLGIYFFANFVLRVLISPSLAFDESEMVVVTQVLAWGYSNPPPLYPWIQAGFFWVFGVNLVALALLKNLLLFGVYLSSYLCAREVLRDQRNSLVAALSLFLIPTFVWEALRSQTHSVLATLMASLTLLFFLRILRQTSVVTYIGLGLAAGLGVLSYYNFALFAGALGVAALSTKLGRRRFFSWKSGLSLVALAVVLIPHGLWFIQNHSYLSELAAKLAPDHSAVTAIPVVGGVLSLSLAVVSFLGLLVVFFYWFLRGSERVEKPREVAEVTKILGRTAAGALLFCAVIVVITGATEFRDRWLEPLLFFVPIYLLAVAERRINRATFGKFARATGVMAILALTILHARIPLAGLVERLLPLNYPGPQISEKLREAGFSEGTVVAQHQVLGGNMRLSFPTSQVVVPFRFEDLRPDDRPIIVVWDPVEGEAIPAFLAEFVSRNFGVDPSSLEPASASAPYLYARQKKATLMYAQLPASASE
jgi:4-amino-4-deoxy-L-arabinose transferase-like glycosyltransferase